MSNNCDHLSLATEFCPNCGERNCSARESSELHIMKKFLIEKLKDSSINKDRILVMLLVICANLTLDWALGQTSNEKFLEAMFNVPK